jgi:hypothetical protein
MTISQAEILKIALRSGACAIRVALPGRVVAVKANGRVDVAIEQKVARPVADEQYTYDEVPRLLDVPVLWQSTQAAAIVMKLQAGDPGLVLFADHALGSWLTAGALVQPAVPDVHGASGAVFSPGLWPGAEGPEPVSDGLRLEVREGVRLDMTGVLAQFTAGGSAAFLALKADVDALQARFDTHEAKFLTHGHATAALGAPSVPIGPLPAVTLVVATPPATINGTTVLKSE